MSTYPIPAPRDPLLRRARARAVALPRTHPELLGLLLLAAVLDFWALDRNGWANTYYSAAVRLDSVGARGIEPPISGLKGRRPNR